jgi:hypothetical protein
MRRLFLALVVLLLLGAATQAAAGESESNHDNDSNEREESHDEDESDDHDESELDISIAKAPIAGDGVAAGAITDFVVSFENPDPAVDGVGLLTGGTVEIVLADDFINTGSGTNTAIILQGWPQSPVVPFIWATSVVGNTITLTMTADFVPGAFGPGPKQVHLALFGFLNPGPGKYSVDVTITPDPASPGDTLEGGAKVKITKKVKPSINAISLLSSPPGPPPPFFNPLYQEVVVGNSARQVGFYLWDKGGGPFLGVDVEATGDEEHIRLVQNGKTVGKISIEGPHDAEDFSIESLDAVVAGGSPEGPSELVNAFLTGQPTGLFLLQFTPDPAELGEYEIQLKLKGGNTQYLYVTVVAS